MGDIDKILKKRECVLIGTVGDGPAFAFGGSDKIKGMRPLLEKLYKNVTVVTTAGWRKHPLKVLKQIRKSIVDKNIDVYSVLSTNGTKILFPYIAHTAKKRNARIFYTMVGIGNIENEVKNKDKSFDNITQLIQNKNLWKKGNQKIAKILNKADLVLVETKRLKEMCEYFYDLHNVFQFNNFKNIPVVERAVAAKEKEPVRFLYFAAMGPEKGVNQVIEASSLLINSGIRNFTVDLYGRLDEINREWFLNLKMPPNVKYKGVWLGGKMELLSQYNCLIFPSIYVEGTPGTIIDARYASLPVISSTFTFYDELVSDNIDGLVFRRKSIDELAKKMKQLIDNPELIATMSKASYQKSKDFQEETIKNQLLAAISSLESKAA